MGDVSQAFFELKGFGCAIFRGVGTGGLREDQGLKEGLFSCDEVREEGVAATFAERAFCRARGLTAVRFFCFEGGKQCIERVVDHVFERLWVPQWGAHGLNAEQRFPATVNVGALRCERIEHAFVHEAEYACGARAKLRTRCPSSCIFCAGMVGLDAISVSVHYL